MIIKDKEYNEPYKLNIGSGQRPFKYPWINVDIWDQGYDLQILTDIKDLSMFPDNSCEILVAHHLFEHIPIHEHEPYLKEWYRVLKPGGRLSIFVPDLKALTKAWLTGKINTFIFNVNVYGAYQGHDTDLHKWAYDEQELIDRVLQYDHDKKEAKIHWKEIYKYNPSDPIYTGADIAWDWWIQGIEVIK